MRARVLSGTSDGRPTLEVHLTIDPASARVAQTHLGARVQLAGWPPAGGMGDPDLPRRAIWVALPPGHRVAYLHAHATKLAQLSEGPTRVAPSPPPRRDIPDRRNSAVRVTPRATGPRPKSAGPPTPWARLIENRRFGDTSVAVIELNPVRSPADAPLTLAATLHLHLALDVEPEGPTRGRALRASSTAQRARLASLARASVINPEDVAGLVARPRSLQNTGADWDYLIITDDLTWDDRVKAPTGQRPGMVAAFAELVAWKNQLGFRARVVTVAQIMSSRVGVGLGADFQAGAADVQSTLRKFLQWAHQRWGTAYVLIGGDQHTVPIRSIGNGQWVPNLPTDFYYADLGPTCEWVQDQKVDLQSVDYHCDVSVGRAPAVDASRARVFVSRVIGYERAQIDLQAQDDPWVRRLLLAAVKWGGDSPTLIPAASGFPPAVNTYALNPSPVGALIQLESVIVVQPQSGQLKDPGPNRWSPVAGTDHIKIHVGPTYKTIESVQVRYRTGIEHVAHNPQASPTSPGWYYTDWADNDGPAHDAQGANCPTSWIIVHLPPGAAPVQFDLQLSPGFRLPYNLLSNLGAGDYRPIPYALDAATTGRGWYFARGAGDSGPSPVDQSTGDQVPTPWLFVRASPTELRPHNFVLDPSTEADTMTEKEQLRLELATGIPAWDQVWRLYDDVVDLPADEGLVPPAQYYTLDRLRAKLNEGQHIISLAGHGLPTSTCAYGEGGDFDRSVADRLANAPRFGIMFANSCLTNRYTADSLSRHLVLENPNGGLVAYVGFSDAVSIGLGNAVERKFFRDLASSGELGIAFDARVAMMAPGSGFPAGDDVRYTTVMMTLLGDPALRVSGAYRYWRAAYLFTAESLVLARLGGYAIAARNSLDPQVHLDWASAQAPGTAAADLREKIRLQVQHLASRSREEAAAFFAATVARLDSYGSGPSGWSVQGNLDPKVPHDWARNALQGATGPQVVAAEICRLADRAFADVLADGRHLLEMVYTRESVEVARLAGFTNSAASTDSSVNPDDHRSWARAIGTTLSECRDDLVGKYHQQVDHQHALGPGRAASFYADTCLRLNAFGVDFGSASANWQQYQLHHDWAMQARKVDIKDALAGRVRRLWDVLARPEAFPPRLEVRVPGPGPEGETVGTKLRVGPLASGQSWVGVVRLVNTGGGEVTVTGARLVGPVAALGGTVVVRRAAITALEAAEVELALTAIQPGAHRGELRIATLSPEFPTVTVDVEVTASGATLRIEPGALDLGAVKLGSAASGRITISNDGNLSAGGLFLELAGAGQSQFTIPDWGDPNIGIELTAGRTVGVGVFFTPTERGAASGELLITCGPSESRKVFRVPLTARGMAPLIASPDGAGLDFGLLPPGSTAQLPLILANTGDADLVVDQLDLQLGTFSPFAIAVPGGGSPPALPQVISPGEQAGYEIQFWAPRAGSLIQDTLVVQSDARNARQLLIPLVGGAPGPGLATPTEAVNFGVVTVGDPAAVRDITIMSSGTTAVTVLGIALDPTSSAFALAGLPTVMPTVLPAGERLTIQATFAPSSVGSHRATVVISSDDPKYPRTRVSVAGTAK